MRHACVLLDIGIFFLRQQGNSGLVFTRIRNSSLLLQGASGTRSGSRQDVLEAATDYSLAGSNPPYKLKDTNDKNDIDKTNNIMNHNDDIQHAAKAGGGAANF